MANITYRVNSNPAIPGTSIVKGTPLTNVEVDANFRAIDIEVDQLNSSTVRLTGDQTIAGVKAFSGQVNGKPSGTDAIPAFFAATTGGTFATMWARRGVPFHTVSATVGSSYATALSHQYTHNNGWNGVYSVGVLNHAEANAGSFVIHHLNSGATQDHTWKFNGATGEFISHGSITAGGQLRANSITNAAGTGAPNFPNGITVPNDSFSLAQLQNIPTGTILGRSSAGTGDVETLTGAQVASTMTNAIGQLAGMRNLLINGNFRINQRGYVSGTAVGAANTYTLDRWRVVTSGQNVPFSTSGNGNQITAPAGGIEQVIEGINIGGGSCVLNWTGTATATVDGTPRAKGESFTLAANTNATVRLIGGTASLVQLEPGTVPTPFEHRPFGMELALCQRYYEVLPPWKDTRNTVDFSNSWSFNTQLQFKVTKRAVPTMVITGLGTSASATMFSHIGVNGCVFGVAQNATGAGSRSHVYADGFTATSEL